MRRLCSDDSFRREIFEEEEIEMATKNGPIIQEEKNTSGLKGKHFIAPLAMFEYQQSPESIPKVPQILIVGYLSLSRYLCCWQSP